LSATTGYDCIIFGNCVSSQNYPHSYGDRYECTISVLEDAQVILSDPFIIELGYDILTVAGVDIRSTEDFPDYLSSGDTISWASDSSIHYEGWEICFSSIDAEKAVGMTDMGSDSSSYFTEADQQGEEAVGSDSDFGAGKFVSLSATTGYDCIIFGNCVSSQNYPHSYGDRYECTISVLEDAQVILSDPFDIEVGYDILTVAGVDIRSAEDFPDYLLSGDTISWTSDSSIYHKGWEICFSSIDAEKTVAEKTVDETLEKSLGNSDKVENNLVLLDSYNLFLYTFAAIGMVSLMYWMWAALRRCKKNYLYDDISSLEV